MLRRTSARRTAAVLVLAGVATALAGCAPSATPSGRLVVVASSDVYGNLARQVGGRFVDVQSLLDDPSQDPHSYQATVRDRLAVSRARIVIENGGGYDDFMHSLLGSAREDVTVIDAVRVAGASARAYGEPNEHVWYDLTTVRKIVTRIADGLAAAQPRDRVQFDAAAGRVQRALAGLERTQAGLRARFAGTGVAITEPVPAYLLAGCGLVDRTPAKFSASIEAGNGVPASVLQATLRLFAGRPRPAVSALVYNAQTGGTETSAVIAAARAAGVPVVPVTETLPAGDDYQGWMADNLAAIGVALTRSQA